MKSRERTLTLCVLCFSVLSGTHAWSQPAAEEDPNAVITELYQRLDRQEAQIERLQRQVENASQQPVKYEDEPEVNTDIDSRVAALEELLLDAKLEDALQRRQEDQGGFTPIRKDTTNERFNHVVGGRILIDGSNGGNHGLLQHLGPRGNRLQEFMNGHEFRSARILAQGIGYGIYEYKIEVDFFNFNQPVAADVYMGTKLPVGKIRIGHFRERFSLEDSTSRLHMPFMERSLPNAMAPGRGIGVQYFGTAGEEDNMSWAIGTFYDDLQQQIADADGDVDNNDNEYRSFNLRLTRLLWHDDSADGRYLFHVGGAFRFTEVGNDDSLRFRARPEVNDYVRILGVDTGDTRHYHQYVAEAAWTSGPLSVQGEYIYTQLQNAEDSVLHGWYVQASYFLTGDHRPYDKSKGAYGRPVLLQNAWWVDTCDADCKRGWGAWELAARVSYLDFDDDGLTAVGGVSGTRGDATNYSFAINWWLNPHMRIQGNYIHSSLNDAVTGRSASLDVFMARFAVDF